jgi:PIN domain nuclease of toxin-antitoxin system
MGRLDAADLVDDIESIMTRGQSNLLAPAVAQVIRSSRLPCYYYDPLDRLLAA